MTGTELQLIKQEKFGEVQADIYSDSKEMFMTANQLGECLGYSNPTIAINKLATRNEYLKSTEFSVVTKLVSTDGKAYETRLFNEDGIYEITFLAKTEVAKKFRAWVRGILKALRNGEMQLSSNGVSIVPEILANKIDQLIGYNEQLVKENKELAKSISTIRSEVFKIAYKPTYSAWKTMANSKILEISKTTEIPCTTLQNQIFLQMKENGCDLIKLSNQYAFEKGIEHCPIIEYIDKTESIKIQFDILLDKMIEKTASNPNYQHNSVVVTEKYMEAIQKTQEVEKPSISIPSIVDSLKATIQPLIEKYKDPSTGGTVTYRKVYAAMGVGWLNRQTRYKNEYKLKNPPKKMTLIENDPKLMKLFTKTVSELLEEQVQ